MGMNFNLTITQATGCTAAPKVFSIYIVSNDPYEELGGFGALDPRLTTASFDGFVSAGKYGQIDLTLRDTRNMIWKSSVTPNISLVFTPPTNCSSQTIDYKSNGFYRILY